ncbi:phage major capsid protein [Bacteroides cellulosilyticus]|jgi:HK97 family phage major capsid protein|uniref:phage major capsid protein n=1 Tax=Bacteroides cellulosilyticus TaxID=246787 RepID=UPI00189EE19C|nr:phage major capsid protein [Bacteroides cellulosilyticus]DAU32324.1 MAG TPA: major capsid protein [Caudoviricetes sp.]
MTKLEEVALLKEQMRSLLSQAKTEKRSLTEDEQAKFNDLMSRKNQIVIDETLRSLENCKTSFLPENKRAAFAKVLFDVCNHRSLSEYGSFADAKGLTFSMRADETVATNTTDASSMIPTTIGDVIEPLEKGLIISKLGIKMQYGLVGELIFPTLAAVEATIEGENTKLNPTKLDIGNLKASPWRVGLSIPVSNDAIDQTNDALFDITVKQLSLAVARLLNKVMFSNAKQGKASKGVFVKDTPNVEYETAPTFENVVALETAVMDENVDVTDGTTAYICSPKMCGKLKTTRIEKGSPEMVLKDGVMNGYPVFMTNYMGADEIGFGVFSNVGVGQWGKIRLTVDDISLADTNETKFTLNSKYDIIVARPEAFAIAKKKVVAPAKA